MYVLFLGSNQLENHNDQNDFEPINFEILRNKKKLHLLDIMKKKS